eukprot:jgi/Mesvir1/18371/Mv14257-RA.1
MPFSRKTIIPMAPVLTTRERYVVGALHVHTEALSAYRLHHDADSSVLYIFATHLVVSQLLAGAVLTSGDQPQFHDGMKEWSCCKKRSHDFSMFMEIPGCTVGKHTLEKPPKPIASSNAASGVVAAAPVKVAGASKAEKYPHCPRCRQGFFCSEHPDEGPGAPKPTPAPAPAPVVIPPPKPAAPLVSVAPDVEQLCKNKSCGRKYKEMDNSDEACSYHPGPPIFHERKKGWGCCNVHVYDFDEFMSIPPCTRGRHNANAG